MDVPTQILVYSTHPGTRTHWAQACAHTYIICHKRLLLEKKKPLIIYENSLQKAGGKKPAAFSVEYSNYYS